MRSVDGKFTKGNPGRPRGAENKSSAERKQKLKDLVEAIEADHLEDDLKKLSARDRVKIYLAAHEYLVPKLGRVEYEEVTEIEELLSMTSEERQEAIKRIKEQLNKKQNGR